ncbi:Ig-like domain-containing protein [Pediococcus pentosaceus]
MADRSKQSLVVYNKPGAKVATGGVGTKRVEITGLEGGKQVAKGDYQLAYTDGANTSDKVDVPAFTVLTGTVAVTGVGINPATASIKVGGTTKLTANVAPDNATNKAVTYKSSDEKIATVSPDGTVTAVAVGTANITATAVDGGSTASCAVTVTSAE